MKRGGRRFLARPLPLRVRLTLAVTGAMALVVALTAVIVLWAFSRGLDTSTDDELRSRAGAFAALSSQVPSGRLLAASGEPLAQVFAPDGDLLESTTAAGPEPLLETEDIQRARAGSLLETEERRAGVDDGVRVIAFPIGSGRVAAIAEGRDQREQAIARLGGILAVALPLALLLSGLIGYRVAGAALRPVERIRRRAEEIGETDPSARLPRPGTRDELDSLADTLNDLLERLSGAIEHERRIVSDASHELRTPVSVLKTRLDVALRRDLDAADARAVLLGAQADTRRIARLADDILVLARADQGRLPLRTGPIDVQDLLEGARSRNAERASELGREIEVAMGIDGGAVIDSDRERLDQVLDNLVANSLAHGDGVIELAAGPAGTIAGELVEISVSDSGPGFPAELTGREFERFARAGESSGSGLGLAIVAALARALGAELEAGNREGGGARVALRIASD